MINAKTAKTVAEKVNNNKIILSEIEKIIKSSASRGEFDLSVDTLKIWPQAVLDKLRANDFIVERIPVEKENCKAAYKISWN